MIEIATTTLNRSSSISAQRDGGHKITLFVDVKINNLPPLTATDSAVFEAILPGGMRLPLGVDGMIPNADGTTTVAMSAIQSYTDNLTFLSALATTNGAKAMQVGIQGAVNLLTSTTPLTGAPVSVPVNREIPPAPVQNILLSPSSLNA